jgi:hypothetical protein
MATHTNAVIILQDGTLTNNDFSEQANIDHTKLRQRVLSEFRIDTTRFRVWDAINTNPVSTAASDDLAIIATWGTSPARISAGDCKAIGATTRRIYFSVPVPFNYEDGETIQIRFRAKMETTVADVACTIDCEAYTGADGVLSGDLVTSSAQSMNSLTASNFSFTINPSLVDPGDLLECRLTILCNDAATATAVTPLVYEVSLLCDTRG